MNRTCPNCGLDNPAPRGPDDVWCRRCKTFLGFPTLAPSQTGLSLALHDEMPITVAAGQSVSVTISVRNVGTVVDEVTLRVSEQVASWVRVVPERVNLYPGEGEEIEVVFSPPRTPAVLAGLHELELTAATREGKKTFPEQPEVHEFTQPLSAVVEPFVELQAALVPVRSSGPAGGTHRLLLENKGNHSSNVTLTAEDPDELLDFQVNPYRVTLAAGAPAEIVVAVKPKHPLVGSMTRSMPFSVAIDPAEPFATPCPAAGGIHVQEVVIAPLRVLLAERDLRGRPGDKIETYATVHNTSPDAETFHFYLMGPTAEWGRLNPEVVVAPGNTDVRVDITMTLPPVGTGTEGWLPWGLRCVPSEDTDRAASAEGGVTILPFDGLELRVLPNTVRGRWKGRFLVTVRNTGVHDGRWRIIGVDPKDEMSFAFSRSSIDLQPGTDTVVAASVRLRKPVLAFGRRHHRFRFAAVRAGREESGALYGRDREIEVAFDQVAVWSFRPPRLPAPPMAPMPPVGVMNPEAEAQMYSFDAQEISHPGEGWGQPR